MGLYSEWKKLVVFFVQTKGEDEFWNELIAVEEKIIPVILKNRTVALCGTLKDLAEKFGVSSISFMGFLDGINSALKEPLDLESLEEDSDVELEIDLEKLYINLLQSDADCFYNLPEWNLIFDNKKLTDLKFKYLNGKTITNPNKIGRNDICPCGSGKKYKNCCGK